MIKSLFLTLAALAFTVGQAVANDVSERLTPGALSFTGGASFTNAKLAVYGPDDFEAEESSSRGLPVFRVRGGLMKDGVYTYTLSAATDEQIELKRKIDNGRGDSARDYTLKPFHMQGAFRVSRGLIEPVESGEGTNDSADG